MMAVVELLCAALKTHGLPPTLNPQSSTLSPQPSTVNPQLSNLNPELRTLGLPFPLKPKH